MNLDLQINSNKKKTTKPDTCDMNDYLCLKVIEDERTDPEKTDCFVFR